MGKVSLVKIGRKHCRQRELYMQDLQAGTDLMDSRNGEKVPVA
jgi:hypothetical protein